MTFGWWPQVYEGFIQSASEVFVACVPSCTHSSLFLSFYLSCLFTFILLFPLPSIRSRLPLCTISIIFCLYVSFFHSFNLIFFLFTLHTNLYSLSAFPPSLRWTPTHNVVSCYCYSNLVDTPRGTPYTFYFPMTLFYVNFLTFRVFIYFMLSHSCLPFSPSHSTYNYLPFSPYLSL